MDLRKSIFGRWQSPATTAEAKADWDDDLSLIYLEFGFMVMRDAIGFFRQNVDKRPSIPAIREQCRAIREKVKGRLSDADREHNEYLRDVNAHLKDPSNHEFTPFALIVRDVMELIALKAKAKAKGYAVKPGEIEQWKAWREEETRREWAEMRSEGVVQLRERSVARGGEMNSLASINLDHLHSRVENGRRKA